MICPYCGSEDTSTKATIKGFKNKRYRQCKSCGKNWNTIELPVVDLFMEEYMDYLVDIGEITKDEYEKSIKKESIC